MNPLSLEVSKVLERLLVDCVVIAIQKWLHINDYFKYTNKMNNKFTLKWWDVIKWKVLW